MKIKHFAGYGCVNARKIAKDTTDGKTTLVIEVIGDHECGIVRDDGIDLKRWLVDRFDKSVTEMPWYKMYYSITKDYSYYDADRAVYTFTYPCA